MYVRPDVSIDTTHLIVDCIGIPSAISGITDCYPALNKVCSGYISTWYAGYAHGTDSICLDRLQESIEGKGSVDGNKVLFSSKRNDILCPNVLNIKMDEHLSVCFLLFKYRFIKHIKQVCTGTAWINQSVWGIKCTLVLIKLHFLEFAEMYKILICKDVSAIEEKTIFMQL